MQLEFYKYQGTGNDFVIIDNRQLSFPKNDTKLVNSLCDRRFGIGADGLILLEDDDQTDFKMVYYNADGNMSSMCGNGARCIVAFAKYLKIIEHQTQFKAVDGIHHATIEDGLVSLHMNDVDTINAVNDYVFLDTGSPHHVQFEDKIEELKIKERGAAIRYGQYGESGSNVNFVKKETDDIFTVRTYERGVEDETLSCGTGVTAVAIAMNYLKATDHNDIQLQTRGGMLNVTFDIKEGSYTNIYLKGPATQVFKGKISC